jgi:hypothetical protein
LPVADVSSLATGFLHSATPCSSIHAACVA